MAKRADLAALTAAALEADDLGQIDAALEAVAAALPEAEKAAETAEAAALDPRAKDVAQARRKADDARFEAKRLAAAHDALADHRAAVEAAQVEARRVGEYDRAAEAHRAALDAIEAEWNAAALRLARLAADYQSASALARRVNARLPEGRSAIADPRAMAAHKAMADLAGLRTLDGALLIRTGAAGSFAAVEEIARRENRPAA